jgi:hypothetical protein
MILRMFAYASVLLSMLCWTAPSWATVTCTTTDFTGTTTATDPGTVTETIPNNPNQVTVLAILDRTEAEADPTVTDNQSGTWVLRDGPLNSANTTVVRVWLYERTSGTKGNSTTVSVDWSAAINAVLVLGTCVSDSSDPLTYVSSAAMQDHSATTTWTSNSRTFTAAGVLIGYTGQNTSTGPNTPGTNQTEMNNGLIRAHIFTRPESTGTHAFDVTMSISAIGVFGASLYQETAAGGGARPSGLLLGVW